MASSSRGMQVDEVHQAQAMDDVVTLLKRATTTRRTCGYFLCSTGVLSQLDVRVARAPTKFGFPRSSSNEEDNKHQKSNIDEEEFNDDKKDNNNAANIVDENFEPTNDVFLDKTPEYHEQTFNYFNKSCCNHNKTFTDNDEALEYFYEEINKLEQDGYKAKHHNEETGHSTAADDYNDAQSQHDNPQDQLHVKAPNQYHEDDQKGYIDRQAHFQDYVEDHLANNNKNHELNTEHRVNDETDHKHIKNDVETGDFDDAFDNNFKDHKTTAATPETSTTTSTSPRTTTTTTSSQSSVSPTTTSSVQAATTTTSTTSSPLPTTTTTSPPLSDSTSASSSSASNDETTTTTTSTENSSNASGDASSTTTESAISTTTEMPSESSTMSDASSATTDTQSSTTDGSSATTTPISPSTTTTTTTTTTSTVPPTPTPTCSSPPVDFAGTSEGFQNLCKVRWCDPAPAKDVAFNGTQGSVTRSEIETGLGLLMGTAAVTQLFQDNILANGKFGMALQSAGLLYETTGDRRALEVALQLAENIYAIRNNPTTGQVLWNGVREPVWPTKKDYPTYAGCENGLIVGNMVMPAVYILKSPCLWDLIPNRVGSVNYPRAFASNSTFKQRAIQLIQSGDEIFQNYFFKYFLDSKSNLIQPNDSRWNTVGDKGSTNLPGLPMAWNRRFMLLEGAHKLAAAFETTPVLNLARRNQYDQLIRVNVYSFMGDVEVVTTPNGLPAYDWDYVLNRNYTEESKGIHAAWDLEGMRQAWQRTSSLYPIADDVMVRFTNTLMYIVFQRPKLFSAFVDGTSTTADPAVKYLWGSYVYYGAWIHEWYVQVANANQAYGFGGKSWFSVPLIWTKNRLADASTSWKGDFAIGFGTIPGTE
ncbi:hypothetical protein OIO90_005167 [Microbotryomycetes sp. JL221]|nr:hypothetical protein OIO90_005167 [Microbotryomycetes sp. JL221]